MMENPLLSPSIQSFIKNNINSNASEIALKFREIEGVPIQAIIHQIQGRQKAKYKLPTWFSKEKILFPPTINLEQSSSEITASYKSQMVKGDKLIDLTGGFGIDTTAFSKSFKEVFYVERNIDLFTTVEHNLKILGVENVKLFNTLAEIFLEQGPKVDCIYLDPARRDNANRKIFRLEDSEPEILKLLPNLIQKADQILVKTSPLLDIRFALEELKYITEVHVIAVDNECKEVLYLLEGKGTHNPEIFAINFSAKVSDSFKFYFYDESKTNISFSPPLKYLYEPNVAILKAGAFNTVSKRFNIPKLHANSHLYTSAQLMVDFPGRKFEILAIEKYDKKAISNFLKSDKANIATRNFPDSVEIIRKRLSLKEGGENYLFATTDLNNKPIIIITKKAG